MGPRLPAHRVILTRYGLRAADALECASRSLSCLHYPNHKLERDAPTPINHRVRQPLNSLARTRSWPGSSPLAFRRAVPVSAKAFRPGGIRQGPSMYEMEGPCRASPHRLVSRLAWPAPRATR
jgi:hypothetical protein